MGGVSPHRATPDKSFDLPPVRYVRVMTRKLSATKREENRDETVTLVRMAELFHDHGLSIATRTIYMSGTQSWEGDSGTDVLMAERVIKNLHALENISAEPITILMNNPGGDVYHGLAIYDAIKTSPCRVSVVVRGYAMSMGSIILQAASERLMGPNSVQMIHYGTDSITHHAKTVVVRALECDRINDWMETMYLERIRQKNPAFKLSKLKKMLAFDKFLTAAESIALGLADRIG
jgi:ATP-dependent Clp protease protease subunit